MTDAKKGGRLKLARHDAILAQFGELALRSDDLDKILTEACHLVGEALGTDLAKVMELEDNGTTVARQSKPCRKRQSATHPLVEYL